MKVTRAFSRCSASAANSGFAVSAAANTASIVRLEADGC